MNKHALGQTGASEPPPKRLTRYGPLVFWLAFIAVASTAEFAAGNTSRFIRPFLKSLFPGFDEGQLDSLHFFVRKAAHFLEYAILAFLARRAFITSTHEFILRRWFELALLLVVVTSLLDELHQSFVASRTGSIYDSAIDVTGGLTVLLILRTAVALRKRPLSPRE